MSGNLWMFSDMLDDEDIEMQKHDFITLYQGADYYGLGLKVFTRMAREAGSVYKIGKKALIRRTIFDEYLRKVYKKELEKNSSDDSGKELMEHITDLRKQDITGERFGRLTAVRPTEQRDNNGSVIWELRCDCGNLTYKTVNALKSGRVLSCGCKYRETRSETVKHRRDMVEGTNVSNIVVSKHLRSNNTSGHTGVGLDRRTGKWYAYINFQKKHYNLGLHKDKSAAIRARRAAEARLHDPVILEYWDSLTEKRKKEFQDYLRSTNK